MRNKPFPVRRQIRFKWSDDRGEHAAYSKSAHVSFLIVFTCHAVANTKADARVATTRIQGAAASKLPNSSFGLRIALRSQIVTASRRNIGALPYAFYQPQPAAVAQPNSQPSTP
jgi:hypothetical protein